MNNKTDEQLVIEQLALDIAQLKVDNAFLSAQVKRLTQEKEMLEKKQEIKK